jgi:Co/Zn/Cd efflux system component
MVKTNFRQAVFHLSKMDCSSEEAMVRMKLQDMPDVISLDFDLNRRQIKVVFTGQLSDVENKLKELDLGVSLKEIVSVEEKDIKRTGNNTDANDRKRLWIVLIINLSFFFIEMLTGLISRSMGLVADSLDMLADSLVYGMSLWAVGAVVARKKRVARMSGYLQAGLAVFGLVEVIRRFTGFEEVPDFRMMIVVSVFALIANAVALYIIQRSRGSGIHMKASIIFTANDVIINTGVIMAGILVLVTDSKYPDLIVGAIVFIIVIRGALRILKLGK